MASTETLMRAFFKRVWNDRDLDAADELVADAYTIHHDPGDPWEGQTLDREGFKERLRISSAPFPDLHFEIHDVIAADDRAAVSWTMTGTNTGPMGKMPATGKAIEARGITIYFIEDGRMTGHWQAMDRLAVLQQLGILGG